MIRAILACDENWGIGKNGSLPWPDNKADMKWFVQTTKGGVVVMGRTTFDDPHMPKPLPNRTNVVVTSKEAPKADIVVDVKSVKDLLPTMENVWVIGGAKLVKALIPVIDEFWLSRITGSYDCDTHLPKDDIMENYELVNTDTSIDTLSIEKWSKL
jgi:dihydrofolate reductase